VKHSGLKFVNRRAMSRRQRDDSVNDINFGFDFTFLDARRTRLVCLADYRRSFFMCARFLFSTAAIVWSTRPCIPARTKGLASGVCERVYRGGCEPRP
jgi:hypothetical protein